jgi:Peptidase A4 family
MRTHSPQAVPSRLATTIAAAALISVSAAVGTPAAAATEGTPATTAAAATLVKTVSANWSGYAVTRRTVSDKFERVSGSWTQPAGTCSGRSTTYSAIWVGLGGFKRRSRALEQTGSEVDCTASGRAVYSAWYELVPAGPVQLRLAIHPGDSLSASVAVRSAEVVMQVKNLTTGKSQTVVRKMYEPAPDLTSAEWIVEAPSVCLTPRSCRTLPLTNFGSVSFSRASVTTAQDLRTTIAGGSYRVTDLELRDSASSPRGGRGRERSLAGADPSELLEGDAGFAVTWKRLERKASTPPPQEEGEPSPPAGGPPPYGATMRRSR